MNECKITLEALKAAFDSDDVPFKNRSLRHAFDEVCRLRVALQETNAKLAKLVNNSGDHCWTDNPEGWSEAQQQVLKVRDILRAVGQ